MEECRCVCVRGAQSALRIWHGSFHCLCLDLRNVHEIIEIKGCSQMTGRFPFISLACEITTRSAKELGYPPSPSPHTYTPSPENRHTQTKIWGRQNKEKIIRKLLSEVPLSPISTKITFLIPYSLCFPSNRFLDILIWHLFNSTSIIVLGPQLLF